MNACELTASIATIANTLGCNLTEKGITLLGSILTQFGNTQFTIAAHKSICCRK